MLKAISCLLLLLALPSVPAFATSQLGNRNATCAVRNIAQSLGGLAHPVSYSYDAKGSLLFSFTTKKGFHCGSETTITLRCVNPQSGEQLNFPIVHIYPALNEGTFDPCANRYR